MNGNTKTSGQVIRIVDRKPAGELLKAMRQSEAKGPVLSPGQARLFRSKMARMAAFVDLLAMSFVEGRS
jgi:hypothetical protein